MTDPRLSADDAFVAAKIDSAAIREMYDREGYAVIRGVFSPTEVAEMKDRFDSWRHNMLLEHDSTFVKGNMRVWVGTGTDKEGKPTSHKTLRGVQWPSYSDPVLDKYRLDDRIFKIASSIVGPDIKQIINQMHWKQPKSTTQWRYHQDVRSRKPDDAYRDLFSSYINMGIAVERCTDETGAMHVIPRTHLEKRDFGIEAMAEEMGIDKQPPTKEQLHELLRRVGADPSKLKTLALEPGDVGLWNPFVIHGGGLNSSENSFRSFYIQGFVTAANCDRGHVAFLNGVPQPLGDPVLIQLDNFRETLAENGRYYPFISDGPNTKSDRALEAETRTMNIIRD
eukprot:m.36032 g.36032  ORF g.36032 m.36032 type:complete len:338 (-) comp17243_c0_seq1:113-1126(-)